MSEMEFRKMPTLYFPDWKPGITDATVPVYSIDLPVPVIERFPAGEPFGSDLSSEMQPSPRPQY